MKIVKYLKSVGRDCFITFCIIFFILSTVVILSDVPYPHLKMYLDLLTITDHLLEIGN